MINKALDFLFAVGMCGIVAIFIAYLIYAIFAIAIILAMTPVVVLAGSETSDFIVNQIIGLRNMKFFPIVYVAVFLSLMAESLGFPSFKTMYAYCRRKKAS